MTSVIAGVVIFVVAAALIGLQRGLQMRRLAQSGVPAEGIIEKLWHHTGSKGMARHRLRYVFRAKDGREYRRAVLLSPGERERLQVGDTVAVIYLAENPKISALGEMVEQARRALKQ